MDDRPPMIARIVETLTGTWRALSDLGAGLEETQWKADSDLPGWSVQDILSHVVGVERYLEGLAPADPLPGARPAHVTNLIGELNEAEVAARRHRPGSEVLAEWNELRAVRERTLGAADAAYFDRPMQTPTGPGTMTDFLATRIVDCWVHEQDIRRALGLPPTLAGPAAEHTIDRLARALPMVVGKRGACPEGAAVAIALTGPIERRFVCEVTGGRAAFVETPSAPPAASIALDTEAFVLLANGRRTPAELAGRAEIGGDAELAGRVLAGLNVMI
jgi:uncharacterized protein (TIGR03083 family)